MQGCDQLRVNLLRGSISEFLSFGFVLPITRLGWQPPPRTPNPMQSRNSKTQKQPCRSFGWRASRRCRQSRFRTSDRCGTSELIGTSVGPGKPGQGTRLQRRPRSCRPGDLTGRPAQIPRGRSCEPYPFLITPPMLCMCPWIHFGCPDMRPPTHGSFICAEKLPAGRGCYAK